MSKKIAFLFPGQGSQAVGMGRELAERFPVAAETFAEADAALGFPLSKLCFEGPEADLRLTENTQPAIMTVSVAVARVLAGQGVSCFDGGPALGPKDRAQLVDFGECVPQGIAVPRASRAK